MFAIIIASIGLNVNSTAVIIGTMLVSPLIGPIMGIGLGAGTNSFKLIRLSAYNYLIVIVTFVPSVVIAFYMIRRNVFETNASKFIVKEMIFEGNTIIEKKIDTATTTIKLVYIGKGVNPDLIENAKKKLKDYHLFNANLKINQGMKGLTTSDITNIKSQIIEKLYLKNQEILLSKDER